MRDPTESARAPARHANCSPIRASADFRFVAKVLHIINGDLYAGAERVQDLLALNLPRFGYDVGLVTLKDGLFATSRRAVDAPLYPLGMRTRLDVGIARRVADVARAQDYRALHTHSPRSALVGSMAATLHRIPLIHHVHGPTTHDTEQRVRNFRNAWVERLSVQKAAHLIAVSRVAADYAQSLGVPTARRSIVWNGVETPPAREPALAGRFTFGAVALFRPRKGIEVLVEAVAKLARVRREPFRVLMVGAFESREYEQKIKTLADARGVADRFEWTGFTTDVDSMLRRMDVFVLPSIYGEGLPMVVLEAMALGLPIVAAAVGGVVEAIEPREHGMLVTPGDSDALCADMDELARDHTLREALGRNARKRQIEQFSAQAMAAGVAAVYDRCLRRADAAPGMRAS
jgi:glycosyltransferase involved in cell wall biosynthesis